MLAKKKKRRDPAELVMSAARVGSWYDRLGDVDRDYVDNVVMAIQEEPHISIRSVATSLVQELGIEYCSVKAVEDKLRKMAV